MIKKKRQRHSDDIKANEFLAQMLMPYKKSLYQSWLLELLASVFFIIECFILALLLNDLFEANLHRFWQMIAYLAGCLFIRPILLFFKEKIITNASFEMANLSRQNLLSALAKLGAGRVYYGSDGELTSFVLDEPDGLVGYLRFKLQSWLALTIPLLILTVIAFVHLPVAVILLSTIPFFVIAMIWIGMATANKSRQQLDSLAKLSGRFLDWLRGLSTLKRLHASNIAKQDIAISADDYEKRTMSVLKIAFLNTTILEFLSSITIALVAIYLGLALSNQFIVPYFDKPNFFIALFVLLLTAEFYVPLKRLGAEYHAKGQAFASAKKMSELLHNALSTDQKNGLSVNLSKHSILINTVLVKNNDRIRLCANNIQIHPKQKIAIVGASGAGKSTLIQVLMKFCEYEGDIRIGQYDFKNIDQSILQSSIAYLAQTPALLPVSIADNLRLIKSVSDEEIMDLLDKVGLKSLVQALPKGINSVLSEQGGGLSGGQAQRLSIAQLLLQDSPLWLLDEPTEHLDNQSRQQIMALLQDITTDKTVIWVTHQQPATWLDQTYHLYANFDTANTNTTCKTTCKFHIKDY